MYLLGYLLFAATAVSPVQETEELDNELLSQEEELLVLEQAKIKALEETQGELVLDLDVCEDELDGEE